MARGPETGLNRLDPAPPLDVPAELRDPRALERFQVAHVNQVLERARQTEYYSELLAGRPLSISSLAELRAFPLTTKADVLRDLSLHPPFGKRLRVPLRAIRHVVTTSGTSGAGQEVYPLDDEDERAVHAMAARGFAWAGVNDASVVANTLPLTLSAAGQWYYHGLKLLGATVLEVGSFTTDVKLDYLNRFGADALVGTPSYLYRMALEAGRRDVSTEAVKRFIVAGESWSVEWMRRLEQAWGAKAFEQYGCTQRGMAWSCPTGAVSDDGRGTLHALSDYGIYEVIDPGSGEAVQEGQGELVLTPFVSSASPLVRFATGDCVTVLPGCSCGRPGPCFSAGAVERFDFMVKVRGVNLWPEALDSAVFEVGSVREYEAVVERADDGRETLRIHVELQALSGPASDRIRTAVRERTGLTAEVAVVPDGTITGSIADKFRKRRRLIDRRAEQA